MKLIKPFKYRGTWYFIHKFKVIGKPYEWSIHYEINKGLKMSSVDLKPINQTRS